MDEAVKGRCGVAVARFRSGYNCAQSVLSAYGPLLGMDEDACLRVACPFGAGMGRLQLTCGAVTGAMMVIGLKCGKGPGDGEEKKAGTYGLVREFIGRFEAMHGTASCRDLLGCDINTEAGYALAAEQNLFAERCEAFVRDAALIVEELLGLQENR